MDYYNFNPDFADSLAFLSPAAQKTTRPNHTFFSTDYTRTNDLLHIRKPSFDEGCQRPSSTSLVLRKARDRKVVEQYSEENIRYRPYPCPIQDLKQRPLIRVTVIPNNHTGTQTKLRKRRSSVRKIQSSVSNHESYFKAKNIFLVVAGKKREKIYEIKTTGSEYSKGTRYTKDDDIPIENNLQQLIYSLNMDKKKKKDKGRGKKEKEKSKDEDETGSSGSMLDYMENYGGNPNASLLRDCMCSPPIDTVSPRKSRVRITGKIGLTEDDRYVMRCAATVDGKPIQSNFFQDQCGCPPESKTQEKPVKINARAKERLSYSQRESVVKRESFRVSQRDEIIQTNLQIETPWHPTPCCMKTCPAFRSVETQYSPNNVNTVCFSNIEQLKIYASKDEVVQCNCPQDLVINYKDVGVDADCNNSSNYSKGCNSPLVIISVYPKQNDDEITSSKESDSPPLTKENTAPAKEKSADANKGEKGGKKKQGKKSRPSSPAPSAKNPLKGKEEKKVDKPKGKDKGNKDKPKGNKKGQKKEKPELEKAVETARRNSRSPERRPSGTQFAMSFSKCAECCIGCSGSRNRQGTVRGAQSNKKPPMNWVSAKNDVSNVAINIDGENEFYDVFLRQSDITTDVQVRKTIKDDKFMQGQLGHGSLENFLLVSEQTRSVNKSFSETVLLNQPNDNNTTLEHSIPGLKVRDSIEISHRREEKNSSYSMISTGSSSSISETKFAHNKHFQGDSCNLPNPVERDREIRELLGIQKPVQIPSGTLHYENFAAEADVNCKCSLHCVYRRKRPTDYKFSNIREVRRLSKEEAITQACDDDDVDYFVEELDSDHDIYNCVFKNNCKESKLLCTKPYSSKSYACEKVGYCNKNNYRRNSKSFDPCELSERSNTESQLHNSTTQKHHNYYSPYKPYKAKCCSSYSGLCKDSEVSRKLTSKKQDCNKDLYASNHKHRISCRSVAHERCKNIRQRQSEKCMSKPDRCQQLLSESFQQKSDIMTNPPLCQQLIMNRNINIFLQIEQFTKQKPIILSRKQYDKVKKTIEMATSKNKNAFGKCICKRQSLSSAVNGNGKKDKFVSKKSQEMESGKCSKPRYLNLANDTQNNIDLKKNDNFCESIRRQIEEVKCSERKTLPSRPDEQKIDENHDKIKHEKKNKKTGSKKISKNKKVIKCECFGVVDGSLQKNEIEEHKKSNRKEKDFACDNRKEIDAKREELNRLACTNKLSNICVHCGRNKNSCEECNRQSRICVHTCYCYETYDLKEDKLEPSVHDLFFNNKLTSGKQFAASSTEVRYTSVVYANYKHVTFSSTNVANDNVQPSIKNHLSKNYESNSLHTIFKGPRRMPTPNLGTSIYSLCSDYSDANNSFKPNATDKMPEERKPFLRRLMSCLVMRSKASGVKINVKPAHRPTSTKSTLDSYHINTSLGEIELSSSIYDTSASFYSNHSVRPICSKIKKGFLNSMRGLLTNKKT